MHLSISVGVPAYNEQNNILNLLTALLNQKTNKIKIEEIIVVSSGSTDKTDLIVEELSQKEPRIKFIRQTKREGKASAINEFLKVACNDILVLESADTIPDEGTIEQLSSPFADSSIGMAGAHPVPTNDENSFMGYTSHLLWALHDKLALRSPKCGELVAFRRVFESIPKDTAVDEAWIEHEVEKRNYRTIYVPDAQVHNKGPETIGDFLKQRRRITCGHLDLRKKTKFQVSTASVSSILFTLVEVLPTRRPKQLFFFVGAFALEGLSRFLGTYDYYKKKNKHSIWEISTSTKSLDLHVV